jgi:predicted methyltransferase
LKLDKADFILDAKKHSSSLEGLKIKNKTLEEFYENYYKIPFLIFLQNIKSIIYSKNVLDFIKKNSSEDWDLWSYIKVIKKEKIAQIKKDGSVFKIKKEILENIPKPQEEKEIREKIAKKLKIKVKEKDFVISLFKKFKTFKVKGKWDQMPISQESAIFVVKKILEYIPLNKKFLFVGDDDFVSILLSLADSSIESMVVDADDEVLETVDSLAKKFKLKIKTKKVDIRKQKTLGEKFVGFLVNPIYTEDGVKEFIKFGKNQLSKDGGLAFLEVGNESIGNRFLFLQDFFTKNNLIIKEIITEKIYYPYIMLYKEDREILKRFSSIVDEKIVKSFPKLAASLYIFNYFPKRPKRIKSKYPIYAYL